MPWVETASTSFRARHDEADADDVERVLHSLELTRERLSGLLRARPGRHRRGLPRQLDVAHDGPAAGTAGASARRAGRAPLRRGHDRWRHPSRPHARRAPAAGLERGRLARDARAHRRRPVRARGGGGEQSRSGAPAAPIAERRLRSAGRGCSRGRRAGSPGRPTTPARRSRAGCARARRRASRRASATLRCSEGRSSTCWRSSRAKQAVAELATRLHPQGARAALNAGVPAADGGDGARLARASR